MMAVALEKAASGRFQARIAAEKASALSSEKAAAEEELAKVKKRLQETTSLRKSELARYQHANDKLGKTKAAAQAHAKACDADVLALKARLQHAASDNKLCLRASAAVESKLAEQTGMEQEAHEDLRIVSRRLEDAVAANAQLHSQVATAAEGHAMQLSQHCEATSIMARQADAQELEIAKLTQQISALTEAMDDAHVTMDASDCAEPEVAVTPATEFERHLLDTTATGATMGVEGTPPAKPSTDVKTTALCQRARVRAFLDAPLPSQARAKRVDAAGRGLVVCALCGQEKTMRNLKFDFFETHLKSCSHKAHRHEAPQASTLARFLQPRKKPEENSKASNVGEGSSENIDFDKELSAGRASPRSAEQPLLPYCRGVCPLSVLLTLGDVVEQPIRDYLASSKAPRSYAKYVHDLAVDTLLNFEKASEGCCATCDGELKVLRSRRCGAHSASCSGRVLVRKIPKDQVSWLGDLWPQCGDCEQEEKLLRPLLKRLCRLVAPQALLRLPRPPPACDIFFEKLVHCSVKGCPQWHEESHRHTTN